MNLLVTGAWKNAKEYLDRIEEHLLVSAMSAHVGEVAVNRNVIGKGLSHYLEGSIAHSKFVRQNLLQ